MTDSHQDADRVTTGEGVDSAPSPEGFEAQAADTGATDDELTEGGAVDSGADTPAVDEGAAKVAELETLVAERTADLQRLQAEYVNYKKRVDRDRDVSRQAGIEAVLTDFMPVLDSIALAKQHGDVEGGFKLVTDELEKVTAKHGLVAFGEVGDPFDPALHEALMAVPMEGPVEVVTVSQVMQQGYTLKGRVIRPARVAVANP